MGEACSTHGRGEKCLQYFGRKSCREDNTQKRRHRFEDNIRTELKETAWEGVDCMHLAKDTDQLWAVVNTVMNLQVP